MSLGNWQGYPQKTSVLHLNKVLGPFIQSIRLKNHEIEIKIVKNKIIKMSLFLKQNSSFLFKILNDIVVYDMPGESNRFTVIYTFLSIHYNNRIRLILQNNELEPLHSLIPLFHAAD
jgi:NADH-quinone oxidoreductase subunit C